MCVMAVVGIAPCQCFSLGANQTTSPGRISSIGPPSRCAHPRPDVTINVWPRGCVCQAVRAPGSNVTIAPRTRAGSGASNSGSIRTLPVNQSAGPSVETCEPLLLIFMYEPLQDGLRGPSCRAVALRVGGCLTVAIPLFLFPFSELLKFDRFQSRLRLSSVTNALRALCSWLFAASPTNNN